MHEISGVMRMSIDQLFEHAQSMHFGVSVLLPDEEETKKYII